MASSSRNENKAENTTTKNRTQFLDNKDNNAEGRALSANCHLPWHVRLIAAASPAYCEECSGMINNSESITADSVFNNLRISNNGNDFICGRVNTNDNDENNDGDDNINVVRNNIISQQIENLKREELLLSQEGERQVEGEEEEEEEEGTDKSNKNNRTFPEVDDYYNKGKSIISPSIIGPMLLSSSLSSSSKTNNIKMIERIMNEYRKYCYFYGCDNNDRFNAGVLTTLRYSLPTLRISGNFTDCDVLALCEILVKYCNTSLNYISRLDLSIPKINNLKKFNTKKGSRGFGSHGAFALAKVLQVSRYVKQVYLHRNRIGPYGATAIFLAVSSNPTIETIILRRCRIGERGALAFADILLHPIYNNNNSNNTTTSNSSKDSADTTSDDVAGDDGDGDGDDGDKDNNNSKHEEKDNNTTSGDTDNDTTFKKSQTTAGKGTASVTNHVPFSSLQEVDISANGIGFAGCVAVERALAQRNTYHIPSPHVDLEGNLVLQEVMNGITHGLGLILGMIGAYVLLQRVLNYYDYGTTPPNNSGPTPITQIPLNVLFSCTVYSMSLIVLYTSSTLYHSFFSLQNTKYIFEVMDKCAIYILISGSYTPFMQIVLYDQPQYSILMLGFLWICALCGIYVEAMLPIWQYKQIFSLCMYIGMGWTAIIAMPNIMQIVPSSCSNCIVLGGVAYTSGVPFFVRNNNLDHSIWHLFVLAGSMFHWCAIYFYVVPYGMRQQQQMS